MSYFEDRLGPENIMSSTDVEDMTEEEKILCGIVVPCCSGCGAKLTQSEIETALVTGLRECDACFNEIACPCDDPDCWAKR